jgi:hypothetical protein
MANVKCPSCAREFVRRVSRVGLAEKFLSLFYIYPFKCQLCSFRFRCLERGVRYTRVEEDRRAYDRLAVNCPASFSTDNFSGEGALIDLSMGGCSFSTTANVVNGMILKMSLKVSGDVAPILVDAAVVRHARRESVGVDFLQWRPGERERLQHFVRGLLIGQPA